MGGVAPGAVVTPGNPGRVPGKADRLPPARAAADVLSHAANRRMPSLRRLIALSSPKAEDTTRGPDTTHLRRSCRRPRMGGPSHGGLAARGYGRDGGGGDGAWLLAVRPGIRRAG